MIVLSSCGVILAKRKPHNETCQIKTSYHFQTHKVTVNPRTLTFSLRSLFHYACTHSSLFYNACRALYVYKIMNKNLLGIIFLKKTSQTKKTKPNRFEPVFILKKRTETGRFEQVLVRFRFFLK